MTDTISRAAAIAALEQAKPYNLPDVIEILRALPEESESGPNSEMVEALRQRPMIGDDDAPAAQGEPPIETCLRLLDKMDTRITLLEELAAQEEPDALREEVATETAANKKIASVVNWITRPQLREHEKRLAMLEAKQAETESVVRDLVVWCGRALSSKEFDRAHERIKELAARIAGGEKA